MRRLNTFLALGLTGVLAVLAGLSWDALLHAGDPHLAGHEGIFTLENPAHAVFLVGIALVVVGVVGALDASLRASTTPWSSTARRRATLGAAAVPVAALVAVACWAMTRPLPGSVGAAPPVEDTAASGDHHGSDDSGVVRASAEQQAEADALVTATKLALAGAGYEDVARAEAAGYRAVQPPSSDLVHYVSVTNLVDARVLDPSAAESLVYRSTPAGPVLQGAMYILPSVDSPIPHVGGLAGHWHGHDDLCFSTTTAMIVGTLGPDGRCPAGARNEVTPPMLHVWTVDRPGGPFAGL
jgi:hypothetical protein